MRLHKLSIIGILTGIIAFLQIGSIDTVYASEPQPQNHENYATDVMEINNDDTNPLSASNEVVPLIDRTEYTYVPGGSGGWGYIYGDNNLVGETVEITNTNSKSINVIAYTEGGTERGSYTLGANESAYIGFWIWDGTYYFKVQYTDYSSGLLYLKMKTVW